MIFGYRLAIGWLSAGYRPKSIHFKMYWLSTWYGVALDRLWAIDLLSMGWLWATYGLAMGYLWAGYGLTIYAGY